MNFLGRLLVNCSTLTCLMVPLRVRKVKSGSSAVAIMSTGYHDLFVFMGFPYASSLFPHFVVVASSISLLSVRVLFLQDPSAPWMVFPQLRMYVLGLSPDFGVSLFVVLIVFLPRVVFLLFSSLSLLFPLFFCMCRCHSYCSYCFLLPLYCRVDYYKYSCMP